MIKIPVFYSFLTLYVLKSTKKSPKLRNISFGDFVSDITIKVPCSVHFYINTISTTCAITTLRNIVRG